MSYINFQEGWRQGEKNLGTAGNESGRGRRRHQNLWKPPAAGAENIPSLKTARREKDRSLCSLPSWYPRIPLNDITAIMMGIENRAALEETEVRILVPSEPLLPDAEAEDSWARSEKTEGESPASGAQLDRRSSSFSPKPANKAERERRLRTLMSMR